MNHVFGHEMLQNRITNLEKNSEIYPVVEEFNTNADDVNIVLVVLAVYHLGGFRQFGVNFIQVQITDFPFEAISSSLPNKYFHRFPILVQKMKLSYDSCKGKNSTCWLEDMSWCKISENKVFTHQTVVLLTLQMLPHDTCLAHVFK